MLSGEGPEQRKVCSCPAPSSRPPSSPCLHHYHRGGWSQRWPCLKTLVLPLAQPLGPCSLLTLLLFKVDLRVLLLLFINFYAA